MINTVELGDLTVANANVIISRIQNRRGLKQDLPQPLRPGEIGFALDTRQVFIGADPDDATSGGYNKISVFETTVNAKDITISIANNQLIAFTVPFKKFPKTTLSATNQLQWSTTSNTYVGSGQPVFSNNITSGVSNATGITSTVTNTAFSADDIQVLKNGVLLIGDSGNTTPSSTADFSFAANRAASNTHILTLRTAASSTDEIAICYYSNTAIIDALSNATVIYPGTTIQSFYTTYNIPTYRQIPDDLITLSPTTGHGLIGLEYKHISVTADSYENISSPSSVTLGNLLLSRSDAVESTTTTVDEVSNNTITFSVPVTHTYNVSGLYNHVYVTNPTNTDVYLHGKLFALTEATANTITVDIPSNAFVTSRSVTASVQGAGNLILTGNAEGISANSTVYIIGNANSNIAGNTFTVLSSNSTAFVANIGNVSLFNSSIDSNISFVGHDNYGNVIVYSQAHGHPANSTIKVTGSSNVSQLSNTSYVAKTVTANTIVLGNTTANVKSVTGYIQPDLANSYSSNYITPVLAIDLSGDTTVTDALATVNEIDAWPSLNFIPGSSQRIYLTHRNAYTSVGFDFMVHEDPTTPTASVLKLTEGEYTVDTTVKAKLEKWMNSIIESDDVNLFTSVMVGAPYAASGIDSIDSYVLDIDNTYDEISFSSREEARDFNKTVNNLYFEKTSNDIKGLVNLKTNIELQTKTAAVVGDKTVSYTEMNTATIPAGGGTVTGMTQSINVYNTYLIDYSIAEASSVTAAGENYQRVGTMYISARDDFGANGDVLFHDVSSEMLDTGLTGNVSFSVSLVSNQIVFTALNNVNRDLTVKYLIRRWSSDNN